MVCWEAAWRYASTTRCGVQAGLRIEPGSITPQQRRCHGVVSFASQIAHQE